MVDNKEKIPILLGPTAVGKTAVGVSLARKMDAEIISADSRLVFKFLNIGTAKPTREEMCGIPHHMIDLVMPNEDFAVADYHELAYKKIDEVKSRSKNVLVVGGTGLYVRALVDNPSFQGLPPDPELREEILSEIREKGSDTVFSELAKIDPVAAGKIHPNNIPRLVRAIEVIRSTGGRFSDAVKRDIGRDDPVSPYNWIIIGLNMDRELLYKKINHRVRAMIDSGWVDEVRNILAMGYAGNEKPLKGLGYRDIVSVAKGEVGMGEAIGNISRDTRRFAKRQMTFFRKIPGIKWIELSDGYQIDNVVSEILKIIELESV
jgi:tRNA dimethylallyltransferase